MRLLKCLARKSRLKNGFPADTAYNDSLLQVIVFTCGLATSKDINFYTKGYASVEEGWNAVACCHVLFIFDVKLKYLRWQSRITAYNNENQH